MPHIPKAPAACADLHLGVVSRTLAKHYGDIPAAARELGVSRSDLRHLTWSRPRLLEEAEIERQVAVDRAMGVLIQALNSDDPLRRQWAAGKILSSHVAREHPFSPANRCGPAREGGKQAISISWVCGNGATDVVERDGRSISVPRYGDVEEAAAQPAMIEHQPEPEPEPEPAIRNLVPDEKKVATVGDNARKPVAPALLVWHDPYTSPPPLVAHLYQPHTPKPRGGPPQPREARKIIYE